MSDTRSAARPIAIAAVTVSALLLLVALFVSSPWQFAAGLIVLVANVIIGVKFPDSRKLSSVGAILAAVSIAVPPFLGSTMGA